MAKGNRVVFLAHILEILRLIATKTRKICMCSAGRESVTITADGDVYPCQLYIGMEMFNMGNVYDDDFPGDKFKKVREMLYNINVYKSPACSTCWARFLCGGDCHYLSYITNKNLSIPRNQRCLEVKSMIDALLPEIAEIFQDEIKTKNLLKCLSSRSRTMSHDIC